MHGPCAAGFPDSAPLWVSVTPAMVFSSLLVILDALYFWMGSGADHFRLRAVNPLIFRTNVSCPSVVALIVSLAGLLHDGVLLFFHAVREDAFRSVKNSNQVVVGLPRPPSSILGPLPLLSVTGATPPRTSPAKSIPPFRRTSCLRKWRSYPPSLPFPPLSNPSVRG